ncbi:carbamoyl phosphate synthase small subunit [Geofilum rubicundum]|uniref:Carbamoyl-phosphate synthase small chain n=1 Tax=Geofilum rubicundum JCM 15548 TaxID=1236989 RepID=A0A0E9LUV5_9BACT|nr:carbamoyl phosphate synthase small subunit [Geofilum rubicundum]GAO29088.1 carbamoyl-phosphate synthase small chain [Geofilum rubicundum JCM 15548]
MPEAKEIKLILEDGTVFTGKSFGCHKSVAGEVVFNTAMTGYPESLTDPSYKGQILVSTYPLIGNYGVPSKEKENGIPKFYESDRIHVSGLIVSDYSFEFSHWNAENSLSGWLKENEVPGIFDVDTRELTKLLRDKGPLLGKIVADDQDVPFYNPDHDNLAALVCTTEKEVYGNGRHKVVLVDTGAKYNILRCLLKRDTTVVRVPWDYDFSQEEYDGVMLSNGPGNPEMYEATINNIQKALKGDKRSLVFVWATS